MISIFETVLTALRLDEVQQAQIDSVAKRYSATPEQIEAWLRDSDPTPNLKYGVWILKQWKRAGPWQADQAPAWPTRQPSDREYRAEIQNNLSVFDRAKKTGFLRGDEGDINKYATLDDLVAKVEEIPEEALVSRRSMKRRKADPLNIPGSKVIRVSKDGHWKIVRVETPDACMFHGKGTDWCTRGSHHAGSYTDRGPLYVIYTKTTGTFEQGAENWQAYAQYTHDYGEVLDTGNGDIPWDTFSDETRDEILGMMAPESGYEEHQEAYEEYVDMAVTGGGVSALARQVAEMEGADLLDSQGYQTDHVNAGGTVDPPGLGGNTNDPVVLGNIRGFMKDYGNVPGVNLSDQGEYGYVRIDLDVDNDEMWQTILSLQGYGIYDDDAYNEAEREIIDNAWEFYEDEFKKQLKAEVDQYEILEEIPGEEWVDAIDAMDGGDLWELIQNTMEVAETYWEFDGNSYGIDLDKIIENINWEKLARKLGLETPEERREREAQAQKAREKAAGQKFFPGMENLTQAQRDVYALLIEQGKMVRKKVKKSGEAERVKELEREVKRLQRGKKRKVKKPRQPVTPTGVVLWEGSSWIDGGPIVAILTFKPSAMTKIGDVTQVWILRSDISPTEAIRLGLDRSICGDCPHRHETCYVVAAQAPQSIWHTYKRERYPAYEGPEKKRWDRIIASKRIRWGAYGDPALIPLEIVSRLSSIAVKPLGFTHQWCVSHVQPYKAYFQASVDTPEEWAEAEALGWGNYRVVTPEEELFKGEKSCPASAEMADEYGKLTTCQRCGICGGTSVAGKPRHIAVQIHGGPSKEKKFRQWRGIGPAPQGPGLPKPEPEEPEEPEGFEV